MRSKKKKKIMIIITSIVVVLLIIGILIFLYLTTDMFKSNETLFAKYMVKAFSQVGELSTENKLKEAEQLLENNKYLSNIEATVNYNENGNTDNNINNMKIKIDSQIDKASQYDYKDIQIQNNDEKIVGIEYLKQSETKAIKLNGIKQFVSSSNIKESIKTIESLNSINTNQLFEFSEEEKETLKNRYIGIINQNITPDNYSKQSGAVITVHNKQIRTNAYSIKITKEKFNDTFIKVLEQIKTDDIILNKIQSFEDIIKQYNSNNNYVTGSFKDTFITIIDNIIEEIKNNNIGQQERTMAVYESNGNTVRISVQTEEGTLNIDFVNEDNNKMIELKNTKLSEKENSFTIKTERKIEENLDSIIFYIKEVKDDVSKNIELSAEEKLENNNLARNIALKLYNDNTDATLNISEQTTIVNEFTDKVELSEDNYIDLSTLDAERVVAIQDTLNANMTSQLEKWNSTITIEDILNIIVNTGWLQAGAENIETNGNITETEKNRFNSQFEFFAGEEVSVDSIKQLTQIAKNNLDTVKVTQYKEKRRETDPDEPKEYVMVIQRNNVNENVANTFLRYIEEEGNRATYTVRMEYDAETGLINNIYVTLNE